MIPRDTVQLILDTAQIADVVSDYVSLKRRGASLVACCPFHHEKTPSFYVTPAKGIFKCFGCSKSGTAVGFVMEMEHCSYVEALRLLAKKYHIEIIEKEESPEEIALRQRNESLLITTEYAQKFFKESLQSEEGRNIALQYYHSRGISDETIEKFGLGWAPSAKTALIDKAIAAGYKPEYLLAAGLAVQREDGSLNDKFRERVMFPIHSVSGRIIAYSGRTLRSDNPAKYVNSPETEIYIKSRNLLGIFFAKAEISRQNKCILVEGNVDMVMMHQLGITNVVASCGTSLTVEQVRLIHKFTENITIMYDGDNAGIHAALRGLNLILTEGMNVKIVLLPPGEDPDSYSRKHTLEEVQSYITANETDFISFKTKLLVETAAGDPLKKAELINDISDTIAQIPDAVKRSTYIEHTALQFAIESSILFERVRKERKRLQEEALKANQRIASQARNDPSLQGTNPSLRGSDLSLRGNAATVAIPSNDPSVIARESIDRGNPVAFEDPVVAKPEEELIYFLLTHGCDLMVFESDSDYYCENPEDRFTVADLIRESLEQDGSEIVNSVYRFVYEAFYALYDEGFDQRDIVKRLLDSPDRNLARLVAELSEEKYKITIEAFKSSLMNVDQWLSIQVPKSLMIYVERKLESQIQQSFRSLATAPEADQEDIMRKIIECQSYQRVIKEKIGREEKINKKNG